MDVSSLKDVRGRQVLLLCGKGGIFVRRDAEPSTFILIKESAENRRGIKVWPRELFRQLEYSLTRIGRKGESSLPAHEINTPVNTNLLEYQNDLLKLLEQDNSIWIQVPRSHMDQQFLITSNKVQE